jgi:hypothetical protein
MKHFNGFLRGLTILVVLGTACIGLASVCLAHGDDGQGNSRILPPNSRPFGLSYAEWSAKWWQWAIARPTTAHPLFETADCNAGQSGNVWFLGGSFVNSTASRSCTVPSGTPIFLPILNAECSTAEPDPFHGNNEAELRACAKGFMDNTAGLFASIDGSDIQDVGNAGRYRVQSPLYSFSGPDNNVMFIPGPVSGQSVSDGVWLMLAPLSVGHHTLHFGGVFDFSGFLLSIDQVYNLTVLPRGRGRGEFDSEPGNVQQGTWSMVKDLYRR